MGLAVGAGGLAAVANFLPWPAATAVGVLAGGMGFAGTQVWEHRAARRALDQAWQQATTPGPAEEPTTDGDSLLTMLNPDEQVVAINQVREQDVRALVRWCTSDQPQPRVWLVAGGPGSGKTRLLVEATTRLRDQGWWCGWVRRGHGLAAVEVACTAPGPVLLVVDDADTRTDLPTTLTTLVQHSPDRVRGVLVAREFGPWWATLRGTADPDTARLLPAAAATTLRPLGATSHDQQQLFTQALRAFARHTDRPVPDAHLAPDTTPGIALLLIHAAAAVTVHHQRTGPISVPTALTDLFTVEETWWQQTTTGTPLHDLGPGVLRAALITAVLFGAADRDHAITLLQHLPGLAQPLPGTELLGGLADWLRDLYPHTSGSWLAPHLPARLAEYYTVTHLATNAPLQAATAVIATTSSQHQGERMLRILAHATAHTPTAAGVITALLTTNPDLLLPAIHVARTGAGPIDRAIAHAVATTLPLTANTLATLAAAIPYPTQALPHTAVAVTAARFHQADTDEHRAGHLTNLGRRLSALGRREEALTATTEAVEIRRRLAAANPDRFESDLARSLMNLGADSSALGRREEALTAATEAVVIYRRLTAANPDAHEPDLAGSLTNLGRGLSALGRREEALTATTEAV
ncbi:MAG TPA: tetratricopeptide repeat protein, partial [Rugosimonospora sp.]|nr:tetratricopeptide repeat protein [Rugosimonospora sp.]